MWRRTALSTTIFPIALSVIVFVASREQGVASNAPTDRIVGAPLAGVPLRMFGIAGSGLAEPKRLEPITEYETTWTRRRAADILGCCARARHAIYAVP